MAESSQLGEPNSVLATEKATSQHAIASCHRSLREKQDEALKECDRLIQHFSQAASKHKRSFRYLKQLSIALTLVVTVLSTLAASKNLGAWEWVVPVLSSLAALSTTLLSQTNAQKTWIHSRNVQQNLQVEKFLYLQDAGSYVQLEPEEKTRLFSDRVMEIGSAGHEGWGQAISEWKN